MSYDQFGLWLNNRNLLNKLNDSTLISKQNEIISFFGGFREIINLCMKNAFTIDLRKHQQLFILINKFKEEQNKQLLQTSLQNKIIKRNKSSLLHASDIGISIIFTFLNEYDHISLQNTCATLTIIGRRKESCSPLPLHSKLIKRFEFQHKLSYIMNRIKSNHYNDWEKAIDMFDNCHISCYSFEALCHSGLIPVFMSLCRNCMIDYPQISAEILGLFYERFYLYTSDISVTIFIKHNIFQLLLDIIVNCDEYKLFQQCVFIFKMC
eukprot:75996_1